MHTQRFLFAIGVIVFVPFGLASQTGGNKAPVLSPDEIQIYRAVLQNYEQGGNVALNVSIKTFALDRKSPLSGLSDKCVEGLDLSINSGPTPNLTMAVLTSNRMKLVDSRKQGKIVRSNDPQNTITNGGSVDDAVDKAFSTALFSMSGIAFDNTRQFAAVAYSFWCGSLCGNGSTLIFKKVGQKWKLTDRQCGAWIS